MKISQRRTTRSKAEPLRVGGLPRPALGAPVDTLGAPGGILRVTSPTHPSLSLARQPYPTPKSGRNGRKAHQHPDRHRSHPETRTPPGCAGVDSRQQEEGQGQLGLSGTIPGCNASKTMLWCLVTPKDPSAGYFVWTN